MTSREAELVADVLSELIEQAAHDVRQAVSERLSLLHNVPTRLVMQLANDDIEIATPVLKNSPSLGEYDLMYIIKAKPAEYWRKIAMRDRLADPIIDELANAGDFETALALAENKKIKLTGNALLVLADLAQTSEALAAPLVRRDDVPQDIAGRLFEFVGQELKDFIAKEYEEDVSGVVHNVVAELKSANDQSKQPAKFMIHAARNFKREGKLSVGLMIETLRRGQVKSFIAQFSVFSDFSPITAEKVLSQKSGQALAIISKACGVDKSDFMAIYMLCFRLWHDGYVAEPEDVQKAMRYFENMSYDTARGFVKEKSFFNQI